MAGVIRTVLGDISSGTLGQALIHEHVIATLTCDWFPDLAPDLAAEDVQLENLVDVRRNVAAVRDNLILTGLKVALNEVRRYQIAGGQALVEATPAGLGRDVRALRYLAERTGIHIVAGSGYYSRQSHTAALRRRRVGDIADELVTDIRDGVDDTGVRAGVIGELGASDPLDATEKVVLRAAVTAQRETGAAIIVHTPLGERSPLVVARALERLGAVMPSVIVSHVDARFRTRHHLYQELARTGAIIGFDTFGRDFYYASRGTQHPSDADRVEAVVRLWEAGYGEQIALSQDVAAKTELASFGGRGYDHVLVEVVPRLLRAGLTREQLRTMLVTTPARVLAIPAGG